MKITTTRINRTIEIVVDFEPVYDIAASDRIQHRMNTPKNERYSDEQLQWYNDMIDNVINVIQDYAGFNIVNDYQSSESYSYYIEFEAFTSEGKSLGNFNIKIRIADHKDSPKGRRSNSESAEEQVAKGKLTIFRSIKINKVTQEGLADVVFTMQKICDGLLEGNLKVLDTLGGNLR